MRQPIATYVIIPSEGVANRYLAVTGRQNRQPETNQKRVRKTDPGHPSESSSVVSQAAIRPEHRAHRQGTDSSRPAAYVAASVCPQRMPSTAQCGDTAPYSQGWKTFASRSVCCALGIRRPAIRYGTKSGGRSIAHRYGTSLLSAADPAYSVFAGDAAYNTKYGSTLPLAGDFSGRMRREGRHFAPGTIRRSRLPCPEPLHPLPSDRLRIAAAVQTQKSPALYKAGLENV